MGKVVDSVAAVALGVADRLERDGHPGDAAYLRSLVDRVVKWPADVVAEIATERSRQIADEGWTPDHDDEHRTGALARAASAYAMFAGLTDEKRAQFMDHPHPGLGWPFPPRWWKPKDRRRDLVRAAALLVAEIERLDREAARDGGDHGA